MTFSEVEFEIIKNAIDAMTFIYEKVGGENLSILKSLNDKLKNKKFVQLTKEEIRHCRATLYTMSKLAMEKGHTLEAEKLNHLENKLKNAIHNTRK